MMKTAIFKMTRMNAYEFPVNTTVISGIIGGVCALVIGCAIGAAGILLKRKISKGCCQKAGEKSEETSRNPDAQADTVPSARDLEMYTEIVVDVQVNRVSPFRQMICCTTGSSALESPNRTPN
ncbi:uncharacterized protein LOC128233914 isoform X2 [Mya arenaria]|uniref:uncharacterized protein LOC128233914 isoform X2 n=1 Tax=Mya arenaria TaxID=6604 RepID=UPI0022E7EF5F|nr:uncharacterized protein LOC128233914 isoform X2 [Mya arenaria]